MVRRIALAALGVSSVWRGRRMSAPALPTRPPLNWPWLTRSFRCPGMQSAGSRQVQ